MTQIGLGTTDSTQNLLKLELKYTGPGTGTGDKNNGSMREQKITVPVVGSNPTFTATQAYTYDDLNRLKSATENISTQTWKQTFDYDRYGNRRFDAANTTTLGSCAAAVCNPEINTADNRLKKDQAGGTSIDYDYDANGALIKDFNGQRFGYDAESHQKEFFHASNSSSTPDATYHYDGGGKRVKKIVGTEVTIFVYDASGQLAAEYSTTVVPQAQAKVSYLTTDHLGSPRIITDQNGAVISRKDFAAFGEEVVSSQRVSGMNGNGYDPPNVRQDYTGYQKDGESGLEFAQARYYNTTNGRFTSVDPLTASASIRDPQTFNRYSYVLNSPYKFTDPLGLMTGVPNPDSGIYLTSNPVIRVWNRQPRTAPPAPPPAQTSQRPCHFCAPKGQRSLPLPTDRPRFFTNNNNEPAIGGNQPVEVNVVYPINSVFPTEEGSGAAQLPPGVPAAASFSRRVWNLHVTMRLEERGTGNERKDYEYEVSYDGGRPPQLASRVNGRQKASETIGDVLIGTYTVDQIAFGGPNNQLPSRNQILDTNVFETSGTITIHGSHGVVGQTRFKVTVIGSGVPNIEETRDPQIWLLPRN